MSFEPSIAADRTRYGVKIDRQEYPVGVAGVRLSLTEIARRIREGGRTPSIRQFAEMVVRNAGVSPSTHTGNTRAAEILLQYVVDNIRYRPDPPMTEWTQSAAITLCIDGAPMCIPVEDCDGLIVALGSLMMAYGIQVRIVKQTFGAADQEHVLIEFQNEAGSWIAADPTPRSPSLAIGQKAIASHEDYIDPLNAASIGMVAGTPEAEFIGVGKVGGRALNYVDGAYEEYAHGKLWRRVGEQWVEQIPRPIFAKPEFLANLPRNVRIRRVGAASASDFAKASTDLANQVNAPIKAGDTYFTASPPEYDAAVSAYKAAGQAGAVGVGPEIDAVGAPQTVPLTQQAWALNGALAIVNGTNATEADARTAQSLVKQISAYYAQAIAAGSTSLPKGGVAGTGISPIVAIVGLGTVGGLTYALYAGAHRGKKNARRR